MPDFRSFILIPVFLVSAGGAQAALTICNDTREGQSVAVGYEGPSGWMSEGWWNIDPGACSTPIGEDLSKRYYYLRVEKRAGPFQGQGYSFCTSPDAFNIIGDSDCSSRGYDTEDFIEIDIGQGRRDYTYRLEQAAMDLAQVGAGDGLEFCNETDITQTIGIGFEGDAGWLSRGWWNIDPGACKVALGEPLEKQYYYYYASVSGGTFQGGGYSFCTTTEAFEILGDANCEGRGYVTNNFAEIDVGAGATGYRFVLNSETGGIVDRPRPGSGETPNAGGSGATSDAPGLHFCNETQHTQVFAVGYEGASGWTSEGWFTLEAGDCGRVLKGALQKRYYYYRSEVDGGDFRGGGYAFCTRQEAFEIVGDTDCPARGFETEDFAEIDVGAGTQTFVFRLTASNAGVPPQQRPGAGGEGSKDTPAPTAAGLRFCNGDQENQSLAIGYEAAEGWTSAGWWNLEPGECVGALDGPLRKRYYYYLAFMKGEPIGSGQGFSFCTTQNAFTIVGDANCEARGYDSADFQELDIGTGNSSFTFNLVSVAASDGGKRETPETHPVETPPVQTSTASPSGGPKPGGASSDVIDATAAGIEVCNQTNEVQNLAFGYEGSEGWASEGWWVIQAGDCATPELDGNRHRYLYYRSEGNDGHFAGANYFFCTTQEAFTIVGDAGCAARGYQESDFQELDIGTEGMFTLTIAPNGPVTTRPAVVAPPATSNGGSVLGDRLGGNRHNGGNVPPVEAEVSPSSEVEINAAPEIDAGSVTPRRRGGGGGSDG
ncbi:MAG: DUF1036 domain-containing protein [Pseudomonadota bacterium]